MCVDIKYKQLKKTPAGESGLSERTPSPVPGIVSTDPAGAYFMTYTKDQKLHFIKIAVESINKEISRLLNDNENDNSIHCIISRAAIINDLAEAAKYLINDKTIY